MSWQIIKQPNDKYCIYSSILDNIIYYGLDRDGLIDAFLEANKISFTKMVDGVIEQLETGKIKPYMQFTMDYKEALATILVIHGQEEHDEVKKFLLL